MIFADAWLSGWETIHKRWESGAKISLGRTDDEQLIRDTVLEHLAGGKRSSDVEIRWMSADEVMASASTSSAGYYYVLQRKATGWTIVTRYQSYVV